MKTIKALLLVGGHWFDEPRFFHMLKELRHFDPDTDIEWTVEEHPEAEYALSPQNVDKFDTVVFYDMPGVTYTGSEPPFAVSDPSEQFKEDFRALLKSGKGLVFLHHAISSWPTWPEYAEAVGGRFHFLPGELDGKSYPGSGYRFKVPQTIKVLDTSHPMVRGIDPVFEITDEIYLYPVMEDKVVPLLRSDAEFESSNFFHGGVGFKEHPTGSNLAGWVKVSDNSPVAYIQFGHGPRVYLDENYKSLIVNAVKWAASDEAAQWVSENKEGL